MSLCACGCGKDTPISTYSDKRFGYVKGVPRLFIPHHSSPKATKRISPKGYVWIGTERGVRKFEHQHVAEQMIGRPLSKGEEVHHKNGNKADNSPGNLIVCKDHAEHALLEIKAKALRESGNEDFRKCTICKKWGPADSLRNRRKYYVHQECDTERVRKQRANQR